MNSNKINLPIVLIALGVLFAVIAIFGNVPIIFVFVALVALGLAVFFRPEIGIAALSFSAVADGLVRTYAGGVGSYWDDALYALIVVAVIWKLAKEGQLKIKSGIVWWAVATFFAMSVISGLLSGLPYGHILTAIRSVLQGSIIFFVIINANFDRKIILHVASLMILCAVVVAGYGLLQRASGAFTPQGWLDKKEAVNITRATSFLGSPNATAGFLALVLPMSIGMALKIKKMLPKIIYFALAAIIFFGLYATLNRAAWIGLGIGLCVFAIASNKRWWIGIFMILLASAILLLPDLRLRFSTIFSDEFAVRDASLGRTFRWDTALQIFSEHPFFGIGPGGFGGAVAYGIQAFGGLYVDNYYLLILSNYGLFGIASFLFLLVSSIRDAFRGLRAALEKDRYLVAGIIGGMVAFCVHLLFENLWDITPLNISFWVMAGLAASFAYKERRNENEDS